MKRNGYLIGLSVLLLIMVSCNNGKEDWIKAKSEKTVEALEAFVKAYPKSPYTAIANKTIDSIYSYMDLFKVDVNKKEGFIDNKGQIRIKNRFKKAFDFSGNFALVQDSILWGIINKKGEYIVKPEYDEISEFSEGLSAVKKDNKWGFIDTTGMLTINYMFDDVWTFTDNNALVKAGNKWGLIDKSGAYVIPPKYERAYINDKGSMMFTYDTTGSILQVLTCKNGKRIIKKHFEYFERKSDFFMRSFWSYTKKKVEGQPEETSTDCIDEFENGIARIIVNEKWGFISLDGKIIIEPEYEYCTCFENNIAIIQQNNLFGYIDNTGKILLTPKYIKAGNFYNGYAIVQIEDSDRMTFIDMTGKPMTNLNLQSVTAFSNGLAGVMINEKWGFIDKSFNLIIQPQFENAESFHNNFATVRIKEKWGLINRKGDIVVDCKYDRFEYNGKLFYVTENNLQAYIDTTGNYIWKSEPPK